MSHEGKVDSTCFYESYYLTHVKTMEKQDYKKQTTKSSSLLNLHKNLFYENNLMEWF